MDEVKAASNIFGSSGEVAAELQLNEPYWHITVTFYRRAYQAYLEGKFVELFVHELCHTIIDPLYLYTFPQLPPAMEAHAHVLREKAAERMTTMLMSKHTKLYSLK